MTLRIAVTLFWVFFVLGTVHIAVSSTTAAMKSIDVTNGCGNWTADNQSCYLYFKEKIDFYKANENCEALGANLVSISSAEENKFIREYVGDSDLPVWIGLYRTNNETCLGAACRNWMWLDGSETGYTQWSRAFATPGQCVHMIVHGTWGHNVPCSTQYGYVCEKKRIIPTTTSEPTTITSPSKMTTSSHPDGCTNSNWTTENRSCYFYMQEKIDFYKANENCEALGANLVSISSAEENQFIRDYVGDSDLPVWIGLYRTNSETCLGAGCQNWKWLDGSETGYTQWAMAFASPGQCVHMIVQGTWGHNFPCSTRYGYVCEQKWTFLTTTSEHTTKTSTMKMTTSSYSVATYDSLVASYDSSTYIGVGVSVTIFIISVSIGLAVYYIKKRRGEKSNTPTSSGTSNMGSSSIGTGDYDNQDAFCGQHSVYANGVQLNTLSGREEEVHTGIDPEHAEESPAYDKVNYYLELSPEYARLQVARSAHTNAESNALYVNVEHQ